MRTTLSTRRGGWFTLALLVVAVLAVAAFALTQLVGRASVDQPLPAPGSAVDAARPTIAFTISNEDRLGDLTVAVDGGDVTGRVRSSGNAVRYRPKRLEDGRHTVQVSFDSTNLFSRSVDRSWTFAVDTRPPALAVKAPAPRELANRRVVRFRGTAERGSRIVVAWEGGQARTQVGPRGGWQTKARFPEGRVDATVTAIDRAGNTTRRARRLVVDTVAPRLSLNGVPDGPTLTETDEPLVYGAVPGDQPAALVYGGSVNGAAFDTLKGADGASAAEAADAAAIGAEPPALQLDGRRFALAVGELPQGVSKITVWARDRAGNVTRKTTKVRADTTEVFGGEALVRGARGEDVAALHARLKLAKVYKGPIQATYGKKTQAAVRRYQGRYRLAKTGVVDQPTRKAMVGRIVINLNELKLRLIRDGRVVKTYQVAIGTSAHPTPSGSYTVTDLQTNPAWFPPDSPWAAGLGPIPAGPGNPLGTRWIGTSAPAIGIHGTYATGSVGTRASHGCIRMHIPDVEELYEQVALGMDVQFKV